MMGKCDSCKLIYVWGRRPLLRNAACPRHGTYLRRTARRGERLIYAETHRPVLNVNDRRRRVSILPASI